MFVVIIMIIFGWSLTNVRVFHCQSSNLIFLSKEERPNPLHHIVGGVLCYRSPNLFDDIKERFIYLEEKRNEKMLLLKYRPGI